MQFAACAWTRRNVLCPSTSHDLLLPQSPFSHQCRIYVCLLPFNTWFCVNTSLQNIAGIGSVDHQLEHCLRLVIVFDSSICISTWPGQCRSEAPAYVMHCKQYLSTQGPSGLIWTDVYT